MRLGKSKENYAFIFGSISLKNSKEVILSLIIDNTLSFDKHVKKFVEKHLKGLMHYQEYQIIWTQNKKKLFLKE